jgi:twitching motility protein PilI
MESANQPESAAPSRLKPSAALKRFAPSRQGLLESAQAPEPQTRYGYRIGDLGLLIGQRALCEVIPPPTPTRIPGTPQWFNGVMNIRGSLVPVFDLRALLGLRPRDGAGQRTGIVLDSGEHAAAVVVDGYPVPLRELSAFTDQPPMPSPLKPFVTATWGQGRDVWFDLDHRQLFVSLAAQMAA